MTNSDNPAATGTGPRRRGRHPVVRVILWLCGGAVAFAASFWAVTSAADLALSAGVYGTPGTYKVESCYDMDNRGHKSEYNCHGEFTPDGGSADDTVYVPLKDTGHDYPDGDEIAMRQGLDPETVQRTGWRGVAGEVWQLGLAVGILCWLAYMAVKPPKSGKPDRSREPSRRQKAADRIGGAVVICGAVVVLGWVANLVESILS